MRMRVPVPPVRVLARLAPGVGGPLLAALLLGRPSPGWMPVRPRPAGRQLAWAEEAVLLDHPDAPGAATELASTRSALAGALKEWAAAGDRDATVTALRSLLDLTRRTDASRIHALCVRAFARARTEEAVRAWEDATGRPYPTFVYRATAERGRGANPAER
ncbi:hypothetical protein ACIPSE_26550 [Streptomyces sp. NPDC090106]|uniref:hypothetical protein n=1 Tax=Streptomyces sp. NPDC090106 TaxID=3365946 RepID=UPI00381C5CBC